MQENKDIKDLFALIERQREYKGLTKRALSIEADITPTYYGELCSGIKTPSIGIVFRLAQAVDCDLKLILRS